VLYLLLCSVEAGLWEPAHDEGVTWTQAIGRVELPVAPAEAVPIGRVYAALDAAPGHSAGEVIERLMVEGGMHPPAYYLGLNVWSRLFGSGRVVLVLPALLAGVLTLFGMRRLARELIPAPRAGEWAMLLTALSPWFVGYSVLARPYAISLCLAVWSTVALLGMRNAGLGRRWQLAFIALSLLGLYHIYHYAFLLVWQLVFLALTALLGEREARRPRLREALVMAVVIALGFLPWLPKLLSHLALTADADAYFTGFPGLTEWPGLAWSLMLHFALGEAAQFFEAPLLPIAFLVLATGTLALWVSGLGAARAEAGGQDLGPRLLWASLPLLPATILLADWFHDTRTLFVSKTSFVLFPFLVLLVVRGWLSWGSYRSVSHRSASHRLAVVGLGAWALLLAAATLGGFQGLALRQTPVARTTAFVLATDEPGHVVALSSLYPGYAIPLLLSLREAGVEEVSLAYAPWYALESFVEAASADAGVKRLSLINLDVGYSPVETWQRPLLQRTLGQARRAGWDAGLGTPGEAASEDADASGGRRPLRIVTPVQAKYFSG